MKTKRFYAAIAIFITMTCRLLAYNPPNPEELRGKADAGEANAQAMLGESYARGEWGVQKDNKMALKYLAAAAKQGHPVAFYNIGRLYENGLGVEKDEAKAKQFYAKAFPELNKRKDVADPRWLQNLACLYQDGLGTEKDLETSFQLSLKSAEQGYARAQIAVGKAYMNGTVVREDKSATVKWFRRAAEQGDADAQYFMGVLYKNGNGFVDKDADEALKWFKMSADQGMAEALKELKILTLDSPASPQDTQSAAKKNSKTKKSTSNKSSKKPDRTLREQVEHASDSHKDKFIDAATGGYWTPLNEKLSGGKKFLCWIASVPAGIIGLLFGWFIFPWCLAPIKLLLQAPLEIFVDRVIGALVLGWVGWAFTYVLLGLKLL